MTAENKIKALAAGVTVTLFSTLIGTGILYRDNSLLKENVHAEKVRTEQLQGEKSFLSKEVEKLKLELNSYSSKNTALNDAVKNAQQQLSESEARVAKLNKENTSIAQLKKENAAIRKIRQDLVAQLESMKNSNSQLQAEITELNRTIAALRKDNENLYARTHFKTAMAYNFRTDVLKKKERLTVRAKRTNHIHISFDVNNPGEMKGEVYIKVKSPNSKEITGELVITENVLLQSEVLTASLDNGWVAQPDFRRVSLKFDPTDKLEKGVYHVMVYSGNDYLGSTQFALEK